MRMFKSNISCGNIPILADMINVIDYLFSEIAKANTLCKFGEDRLYERLIGIERNIRSSRLISDADQEKLLAALNQVLNSMQDELVLKSINDIQKANAQSKVREFAQLVKKLNRTLDRKTKQLQIETRQLKEGLHSNSDIEATYLPNDPNVSNQRLLN